MGDSDNVIIHIHPLYHINTHTNRVWLLPVENKGVTAAESSLSLDLIMEFSDCQSSITIKQKGSSGGPVATGR